MSAMHGWIVMGTLLGLLPAGAAEALTVKNALSPLNKSRPARASTRFIILHTTEGAPKGALAKLRRAGEAHYLVNRNGVVYRIIDKHRVAKHAGRSMWKGRTQLDRHSIGIEVVGYHNQKSMRPAQVRALKELLRQLQSMYSVPDARVLTHSMVAYGTPNRYHRRPHRGRKRCGMNFAGVSMRRALGLDTAPGFDPDVRAGRLVQADRALQKALYRRGQKKPERAVASKPLIARASSPRTPSKPAAPSASRARRADSRTKTPSSVRSSVAASARDAASTIYLFPDGVVRSGAELKRDRRFRQRLKDVPNGTKILTGYTSGGYVSGRRPPSVICGEKWQDASTLYRFPGGRLVPGNRIQADAIPRSTMVFFRG